MAGRRIRAITGSFSVAGRICSGGQVVEQAVHIYDLVRYFAGDVERVSAVGGQEVVREAIDFADSTSASLEHTNGSVSHVSASSASSVNDIGLTIVAEDAYLDIDLATGTLNGRVDGERIEHENRAAVSWESYHGENDAFRKELDDFLAAVRANDPEQP